MVEHGHDVEAEAGERADLLPPRGRTSRPRARGAGAAAQAEVERGETEQARATIRHDRDPAEAERATGAVKR